MDLYAKSYLLFIFLVLPYGLPAFSLYYTNYFLHFNNADFENYDTQTYRRNQPIADRNTDDALTINYANLRLKYDTQYKNSEFFVDASRSAHWGADNFQGRDAGQNTIHFSRLYFNYYPTQAIRWTIGRHKYEIGNSYHDYFFSDVIDGVNLSYQWYESLNISFMTDVLSNSVYDEGIGVYGVVAKDEETIEDFHGNTVTQRVGGGIQQRFVFNNSGELGLRAFGYHLRYAANNKGAADLAENGRNNYNKADGDYMSMGGVRFYGENLGNGIDFDISYAYAKGEDRQLEGIHKYSGTALTLNLLWNHTINLETTNILWLSAGRFGDKFIGMKALSMGGMLLWGYKGYYASPYANFYHFQDYAKRSASPQYTDRTIAKSFAKIKEAIHWKDFQIDLSCLALWETASRAYMGTELELNMEYRIDNLKFNNTIGLYMPSNYYRERTFSRDNPMGNRFLPIGKNSFYGMRFTIEYVLDLAFISTQAKAKKTPDRTRKLLQTPREEVD